MIKRRTLLSALPLFLVGCATSTLPSGTERFSGHFYLKTFDGKRPDSVQGGYTLEITEQSTRLNLTNPLGGTAARVTIDLQGATLERGEEKMHAANVAELSQRLFGFEVPLDMLPNWLKGIPAAGLPSEKINDDVFTQAHWKIDIRRRHANGDPEYVKLDCQRKSLPQIQLLMLVKEHQR
jgi:outer membrane lipoprotein LolB